jgi:hypothetical protein
MRRTPLTLALGLAVGLAGCDQPFGSDAPRDPDPPLLRVLGPERGAIVEGLPHVVVSGVVTDAESGVASLEIDGVPVAVDADGRFSVTVIASPGLRIIHTVARDVAGNVADDARAVMTGSFVATDGVVRDALAARLGAEAIAVLGHGAARAIERADLGALVAGANPVIERGGGGCLSAGVSVLDVDLDDVVLELVPGDGAIALDGRVTDLDVPVRVDYRAACVSGSLSGRIRAESITLAGALALSAGQGGLVAALPEPGLVIEGLELDVDGLPGAVLDLLFDAITPWISGFIADTLEDQLTSLVGQALTGAVPSGSVDVLGQRLTIVGHPTEVEVDPAGARVRMDGSATIDGGQDGPGFVASPSALPSLPDGGVAGTVADDLANQLLASAWSAGVLARELPITSQDVLESDLGLAGLADTLVLDARLPPMVVADARGVARVVAGDVLVDAMKDGRLVTRVALNLSLELSVASSGGGVRLVVGQPDVAVDVVSDGVTGANLLDDDDLETVAGFAAGRAIGVVSALLGELPLPSAHGVSVGNVAVGATDGYVTFGGDVSE